MVFLVVFYFLFLNLNKCLFKRFLLNIFEAGVLVEFEKALSGNLDIFLILAAFK